jgi:Holliday junction resolvasome RuvABC DNA-binding subunit
MAVDEETTKNAPDAASSAISDSSAASASASAQPSESSHSATPNPALSSTAADKLAQLRALGFSQQEAQLALQQADGDVDLAATLLLSSR